MNTVATIEGEAVEVVTAEEEDKIAEAAYLAEMAEGTDTEEGLATEALEVETVAEGDAEEENQPAAEEVEPEPEAAPERVEVFSGYTAEELKEALELIPKMRKSIDTVNGTYGTKLEKLNAAMAELTNRQQSAPAELPPIDLEDLKADFPELEASISKGLSAWMGKINVARESGGQTGAANAELIAKIQEADTRFKKHAAETEAKFLDMQHPDWRTTATYTPTDNGLVVWDNPEFGSWVAKQDAATQTEIVTADSAAILSKHISKYKADNKPATQKTVTKSRTAVLSNAVAPKSAPSAVVGRPKTDDEIAHEAFLKEMRS